MRGSLLCSLFWVLVVLVLDATRLGYALLVSDWVLWGLFSPKFWILCFLLDLIVGCVVL